MSDTTTSTSPKRTIERQEEPLLLHCNTPLMYSSMPSSSNKQPKLPVIDLGPLLDDRCIQKIRRRHEEEALFVALFAEGSTSSDNSGEINRASQAIQNCREAVAAGISTHDLSSGEHVTGSKKRHQTEPFNESEPVRNHHRSINKRRKLSSQHFSSQSSTLPDLNESGALIAQPNTKSSRSIHPDDEDTETADTVDNETPRDPTITDNDVLCGRGGYVNANTGNARFRQVVRDHLPLYLQLRRKEEKTKIPDDIVNIIHERGGRFLSMNTSREWVEVDDGKARAKCSQALRDSTNHKPSNRDQKGSKEQPTQQPKIAPKPTTRSILDMTLGSPLSEESLLARNRLAMREMQTSNCGETNQQPQTKSLWTTRSRQVTTILENDVLLSGQGVRSNFHVGNRRFRRVVQECIPHYLNCHGKGERRRMIHHILNIIQRRGGRFVSGNVFGEWLAIDDEKAYAKCSRAMKDAVKEYTQARRDGLPNGFSPVHSRPLHLPQARAPAQPNESFANGATHPWMHLKNSRP